MYISSKVRMFGFDSGKVINYLFEHSSLVKIKSSQNMILNQSIRAAIPVILVIRCDRADHSNLYLPNMKNIKEIFM